VLRMLSLSFNFPLFVVAAVEEAEEARRRASMARLPDAQTRWSAVLPRGSSGAFMLKEWGGLKRREETVGMCDVVMAV